MVLTDEEEVLNLALHVDADTLAIYDINGDPDPSKFAEILAESISKGLSYADTFAPSVNWEDHTTHKLYGSYKMIALTVAAAYLLKPIADYSETVNGYFKDANMMGEQLRKGVKEMATLGTDSGASKLRFSSSANVALTYPFDKTKMWYQSPNVYKGRRGRG